MPGEWLGENTSLKRQLGQRPVVLTGPGSMELQAEESKVTPSFQPQALELSIALRTRVNGQGACLVERVACSWNLLWTYYF